MAIASLHLPARPGVRLHSATRLERMTLRLARAIEARVLRRIAHRPDPALVEAHAERRRDAAAFAHTGIPPR